MVVVTVVAVDDGYDADVEDGCVDVVVGIVAAVEIVDFVAFRALVVAVVVVVVVVAVAVVGSCCLFGMLALTAWFERDTKAFFQSLKSLSPWDRWKRSVACPDKTVRHYLEGQ